MKQCKRCRFYDHKFCINYRFMRNLLVDLIEFDDYIKAKDLNKSNDCKYYDEVKQ